MFAAPAHAAGRRREVHPSARFRSIISAPSKDWRGSLYLLNEPGIRALCARLLPLRVALVALERPDGASDRAAAGRGAGGGGGASQPGQGDAPAVQRRRRQGDGFDSFVLAEPARTEGHRFRVLEPDSDQTKALRAMTRARDSLVRTRVGLANQLRDQLATFWPGASNVFWSVDSHIALAFLKRYPTPAAGATGATADFFYCALQDQNFNYLGPDYWGESIPANSQVSMNWKTTLNLTAQTTVSLRCDNSDGNETFWHASLIAIHVGSANHTYDSTRQR
jgi:hypothetical protein